MYLVEAFVDPDSGEEVVPAGGQIGEAMTKIASTNVKKVEVVDKAPDALVLNTLAEDASDSHENALLRIYARLRPGNPPQLDKAKTLFAEGGLDNYGRLELAGGGVILQPFGLVKSDLDAGRLHLLLAEYEGRPLAALMAFARGPRAWYLYGASTDEERNRMPTYLLQWEAMRWARRRGCQTYDLWGVPDADHETLESQFESRGDGLWGVYRFKRGFGGELVRSIGAWDYPLQRLLYSVYQAVLARRAEG
jgi:hypothetical protein